MSTAALSLWGAFERHPPLNWGTRWRELITELRVDVLLPELELQQELQRLNGRWSRLQPPPEPLASLHLPGRGLEVQARTADGEHFLYVIDRLTRQVVAYVTFSRLVEIHRRADPHLRAPHTKVMPAWRRQGIASAVYRWWLDSGRSAITGARQSPAARALWLSLARHYPLVYVRIDQKCLYPIEAPADAAALSALNVRAVLLGRGCELADFAEPAS